MIFWFAVCFIVMTASTSMAKLYESIDNLDKTVKYDFIIVGGGTAGCVIVNRLTVTTEWKVLLIEIGPSNKEILETPIKPVMGYFSGNSPLLPYDWNTTTVPQLDLDKRVIPLRRGYMLGGSSSINGMYYARGSSSDYDRYATVSGDPGWSWQALQPFIKKTENWTEPVDNHNTSGQFDPTVHSSIGINAVSLAGYPQRLDARVIITTNELPTQFPFVLDYNSGNPIGLGYLQMTVNRGKRSSSATSYLAPEFLNRSNLDVVVNTQVTRIIQTGTSSAKKSIFGAVDVVKKNSNVAQRFNASKEIIISAGTIGTPHLLLLSGIGNSSELKAVNISSVLDLPDVGKNFSDHPRVSLTWLVKAYETVDDIIRDKSLNEKYQKQWDANQTGPFASIANSFVNWARLPNSSIFNSFSDPASGKNAPHYVQYPLNGGPLNQTLPGAQYLTMINLVLTPLSRGNMSLNTSSPFGQPLIDPHYMSNQFDLFAMREAVRNAMRFVNATAWKDYIVKPIGDLENVNVTNDGELDKFILKNVGSGDHGVGTASMSATNAIYGVVDPDLTVKGASGLRIVDASVLPYIPAAHTQGSVYIIAERAADLIKKKWPAQVLHTPATSSILNAMCSSSV